MPRKANHSPFSDSVLDQLLAGNDPQALFSKDGLIDQLKKRLAERVLNAELDHHLDQDDEAEETGSE